MVRLLGLNSRVGIDTGGGIDGGGGGGPREIISSKTPTTNPNSNTSTGDSGWLIRFFDSSFFCEWIAISYLYKHEHSGVRDYLCNRMYTLPTSGIEGYLFQLCFMVLHKPSPALDKYIVDMCSKSLRVAIKVHWFLLAEAEDLGVDRERIDALLERCQTAALNGDWPPLVKPTSKSSTGSPVSKRMFTKLLSSRRLLSTSSPPNTQKQQQQHQQQQQLPSLNSSPTIPDDAAALRDSTGGGAGVGTGGGNNNRTASDDTELSLRMLKKLMPGPKMRDALLLKKFRDKEDDDVAAVDRPPNSNKDATSVAGAGAGAGAGPGAVVDSESFIRRLLFRDKEDEERAVRSSDEFTTNSFIRRLFKDKNDAVGEDGRLVGDEEKDGFFRKFFRDKSEHDRDRSDSREKTDDDESKISGSWGDEDDGPEFSLFRRFFKIHPEDEVERLPDGITGTPPEKGSGESPGDNFFKKFFKEDSKFFGLKRDDGTGHSPSFLKRLFKDRTDEESTVQNVEDLGDLGTHQNSHESNGGGGADGMTMAVDQFNGEKLKDRTNKNRYQFYEATDGKDKPPPENCTDGTTEDQEFPSSRDRKSLGGGGGESDEFVQRLDIDNEELASRDEFGGGPEKLSSDPGSFRVAPAPGSPPLTNPNSFTKLSGSPLRKVERTFTKPPLPKHSTFRIRKGTYHATLDFVQSLCDMSTGLADVFPLEDRRISLHESLQELNAHLVAAESDGGVCFLMGRGLCRVVHIPEEEAVLLNSREKAPFLICVEVLRCDTQRSEISKDGKEALPRKRSGIPLANGDVQFPKPPPWAFPTWNHPMQYPNTEQLLRTASKAIDLALAQSLNSKVKVVDVSLSVKQADNTTTTTESPKSGKLDSEVDSRVGDTNAREATTNRETIIPKSGGFPRGATRINGVIHEEMESSPAMRDDVQGSRNYLAGVAAATEDSLAAAEDSRSSMGGECPGLGWVSVILTSVAGLNMDDVELADPLSAKNKIHRRVPSTIAMAAVTAAAAKGEAPPGLPVTKTGSDPAETQTVDKRGMSVKATDALAGELWANKKERIRRTSKFCNLPDWDLCSMIVKSGDDCRQEHLAVQLIAEFYDIFQEAGLPLWLRPYEVLVTSSHTALIETIPDTASIHAIKSRNANLCSLREFFCKKYVEKSPEFTFAQRNFVESMAGYSILCYILQVKDRHNGNLLIDEEGHIIHIDFGFMLSNSPGGVNFESAPFKLTRELLEVMDSDAEGSSSEFFDYYKVLCIQGFLLCRKHAERIILLVEMMQDSGCPCFRGGPRALQNLRKRFHLNLTEQQCVALVVSLIDNSLDAWRSRQYDYYQRVLNGIL